MTRAFLTQTNFTAGELDPRLMGRTDLKSFENGAAKLHNVVVETTGGARRRPGTAYVTTAPGEGRLAALETGPSEAYLLVFTDFQIDVYRDDIWQAMVATPWSEAHLPHVVWAQQDDSLLVVHPDIPPQQVSRDSDTTWSIQEWRFDEKDRWRALRSLCPFRRLRRADPGVCDQWLDHFDHLATSLRRPASGRARTHRGQAGRADQHPVRDRGERHRHPNPQRHRLLQRLGGAGVQRSTRLAGLAELPSEQAGDRRLSRSAQRAVVLEIRNLLRFRRGRRPG